ncbi:TrkH family potassium uptake protein [Aeribacillus pallidus]|uniref:TrkH family potassium uptake protein n=1 Tax=Aeribacillus pallidus TaxID=33936 RepID=UPI0010235537|nr:TrkH family potassium uptake protein [Aeribacillus pallidus]RZI52129.1 TrkH family potassium uptake protein [Aeribacillus pallidus]
MLVNIRNRLVSLSPAQMLAIFYFLAITVAVILLSLPFVHKPDAEWTFLDALFTAVSAVSVTGLTTVSIIDTFTVPGIFILMIVLQIGGIGIMTLGTLFWFVLGKKIGLRERQLIMVDQNQLNLSGIVNLMRQIMFMILIIELIGTIILGTYYLKYFPEWKEAYLHGMFSAISATTNAGFDISGSSLVPFAHDYFVQMVHIILMTLGAIGFPVLIETKNFILTIGTKRTYRFSLYTKLTTVTFFALVVIGTILIYLIESGNYLSDKSFLESFFYALFQSATTRSTGLYTMDVSKFSETTLLIMSIFMFIGASPSSVGGGVRTTTVAVILLVAFHFAKGSSTVKVFKREIHPDDIKKSIAVMTVSVILCLTSIVILSATERFTLMEIIFEVCSAFGTTGLSLGITPELSPIGKIIIMIMMFIGRIGILSFIFLIGKQRKEANYHYPKERVIIG